jgi:hypothetical protein
MPLCRLRQVTEAVSRRRDREARDRLRLASWQTRTICTFIAAQAQVDLKAHGGRNPMLDEARKISLLGDAQEAAVADEEDEMRGEQTGYMDAEAAKKLVAAGGRSAPELNTQETDADGNMVGSELGDEMTPDEEALASAARPGSYEGFMAMFGGGGNAAPRGPDVT